MFQMRIYPFRLKMFFFGFSRNSQEGSIGHDVVIKPVPFGLIDSDNSKSESRAHHIVYKRKVNEADQFSDFGKSEQFFFSFLSCKFTVFSELN